MKTLLLNNYEANVANEDSKAIKINMKAKKSLGQNFLTSQSVIDKIIKIANLDLKDIILEIGPGKGILTQTLLGTEIVGKVIAVEKDITLIPFLQEKFSEEIRMGKLILVYDDILDFDFQKYGLESGNYKIVANIPYYITGRFLRKILSSEIQPSKMVLLIQKEVAERIAKDKKESLLSISVKAYGKPKYIQTVKAGNFNPAPKVDSAILLIENISKKFFFDKDSINIYFCKENERRFFEIIKTGFSHKRKFLIGNLGIFAKKEKLQSTFRQAGISDTARAEDVALERWKTLVQRLKDQ